MVAVGHPVSSFHAGPGFRDGGRSIGHIRRDGDEIVPSIPLEDTIINCSILAISAIHPKGEGHALPANRDIGLKGVALADLVTILQVRAHLDDRHAQLVAGDDRVTLQVAVAEAGMVTAQGNLFDISVAKADGINPHQQFIVCDLRDATLNRQTLQTQIFKPCTIKGPADLFVGERGFNILVAFQCVGGHKVHYLDEW